MSTPQQRRDEFGQWMRMIAPVLHPEAIEAMQHAWRMRELGFLQGADGRFRADFALFRDDVVRGAR